MILKYTLSIALVFLVAIGLSKLKKRLLRYCKRHKLMSCFDDDIA